MTFFMCLCAYVLACNEFNMLRLEGWLLLGSGRTDLSCRRNCTSQDVRDCVYLNSHRSHLHCNHKHDPVILCLMRVSQRLGQKVADKRAGSGRT